MRNRLSETKLFHNHFVSPSGLICLLIAGMMFSTICASPAHGTTIIGNTPNPGATEIATDTDIIVNFSENILEQTVNSNMLAVKGSASKAKAFTFEVSANTIIIDPEEEFIPGETATVTIKPVGIEGADGTPLTEPATWEWTFAIVNGIASTVPTANAVKIAVNSKITIKFSGEVVTSTINAGMFGIEGSASGSHSFTFETSKDSIILTANSDFVPAETVTATVKTSGVRVTRENDDGVDVVFTVKPEIRQWQFVIISYGNIHYFDSGQPLGSSYSRGVVLRDLDGDDDFDAFVANGLGDENDPTKRTNKVWLNGGTGMFTDSGQTLGNAYSYGVALGDIDGDDDFDAFVANGSGEKGVIGGPNKIWLNDGKGGFTEGEQGLVMDNDNSHDVAMGDLDRDGDLDVFVANVSVPNELDGANKVLLNNGKGIFTDTMQSLGSSDSHGIALGDVDGDGDLDAFVANYSQPNKVWLNNGKGIFTDSSQSLGGFYSSDVALGDVDGDRDLDAFVSNRNWGNKVWLNNGRGIFADSGQSLGFSSSYGVELKDVDGDGDLDAFVVNASGGPNIVWLNDGKGVFADSGKAMGSSQSIAVSLGDVDGDDDLDAYVGNYGQANRVWLNNSKPVIEEGKAVTVEMDENETPRPFSLTLTASDPEGSSLSWSFDESVAKTDFRADKGLAYIRGTTGASKAVYYTPDPNRSGDDNFDVWVNDGTDSASITVNVKIVPNVPEIAEGDSVTVEMDEDGSPTPFELTLNASDISDPQGKFLSWRISYLPGKGMAEILSATGTSAVISYDPDQDHDGTDRFGVQVSDNAGGSDTITVNVNITPQNDAPVIAQDGENPFIRLASGTEQTLSPEDLAVTVTDPDNSYPKDFILTVQDGEHYTHSDNTITPSDGFVGILIVPVTVNDGELESNLFHLSIKVYHPGDIDASGVVDLRDAILGLGILAGTEPKDGIVIDSYADVNGDEKIGMENVSFILKKVSELPEASE